MSRSTTRPTEDAGEPTPLDALTSRITHLDRLAGRITLRLDEVAAALGVSRRAIERERSAGRFPRPDRTIGKMPLWRSETIRQWVEGGGAR